MKVEVGIPEPKNVIILVVPFFLGGGTTQCISLKIHPTDSQIRFAASRFQFVNHDAIRPVPAPTSTIRLKRGSRRHLASENGGFTLPFIGGFSPWDGGVPVFRFLMFQIEPGMDLEQHGSSHPW